MPTLQYMSRGFVHLVELPPESRWLRLRGPTIANFNLAGGPTTQAEFWQMRFNSHLRSLLVEIWLHEYRQGWRLYRIEAPYFEVGDVFNDGTQAPHFRSVVVFVRFAQNGA